MIVGDLTTRSLARALSLLEAQQQAHQHNIANAETPGFKARVVSFEDSLRRAIDDGRPHTARAATTTSTEPTRIDGNNVRLDRELTGLAENALRHQLVTQAITHQYRLIRAAIAR